MIEVAVKPSSLGHLPGGDKWTFDESVTHVFDDMLERSIPQYQVMRQVVTDAAVSFVQPKSDIVDLGCSRGESLIPLMAKFGAHNRYIGVEVSEPMIEAARERFSSWPDSVVRILNLDLRNDYPPADASVTMLVLTLMFTPINYRQRIIQRVYDSTRPGGAVILVEKLIGSTAVTDDWMQTRYHRMKAENGYSREEIERKALALEGVQVPLTAEWNERLLTAAGFRHVECLWRWVNFAAWIGIK